MDLINTKDYLITISDYKFKMARLEITNVGSILQKIFVGRTTELAYLEDKWKLAQLNNEHFIYVLLNAPGVGKTALLTHFGQKLTEKNEGLFILFRCNNNYNTSLQINREFFLCLQNIIQKDQDVVNQYIQKHYNGEQRKIQKSNWQNLKLRIDEIGRTSSILLNNISEMMKRLANIIPVFFVNDEIQEFQQVKLENEIQSRNQNEKQSEYQNENHEFETGLHYYTRFLKDLMNSPILIVLSGTNYHILNQIGMKIGSPIRQKVKSLVITKFEQMEINEYRKILQNFVDSKQNREKFPFLDSIKNLNSLFDNYRQVLISFSGGHPRTISVISELFLQNLSYFGTKDIFTNYNVFVLEFLPIIQKVILPTILSSELKEAILKLSHSLQFGKVKEWMLQGVYTEQALGCAPEVINQPQINEEISLLVYQLITIGLIIQNGNFTYYLTSYFHLLAYLEIFEDFHSKFLREVMYNSYFQLLCGSHSGFGYTMEHILASIIFTSKKQSLSGAPAKFIPNRIRTIQKVFEQPNWELFRFDPDILCHFPFAKSIDFGILQDHTIFFIQITTANPPDIEKLHRMEEYTKNIMNYQKEINPQYSFSNWFISLFPIKRTDYHNDLFFVSSGKELISLFGEEMYHRLLNVKNQINE